MKKINWKKIFLRIGQSVIICFFNAASFVWLIMNFVGDQDIVYGSKVVNVSFFDTLDFKWKALIYLLMVLGIVVSYVFLKFLYKNHRQTKQNEIEDKRIDKFTKILEGK